MKETLVLTVKLLVITAIVAALLGAVNMITEPIIATNTEATFQENLKEVLPDAEKFDLDGTKLPEPLSGTEVSNVYCGMAADGTVVGYVANALSHEGYGGDVEVMVGADAEGKITSVKVTEMSETPGLGAKCQTDWIDQYKGLKQNIEVNKNGSATTDNKIDAISGATITSKAVTGAVNSSLDAIMTVINDNGGAAVGTEAAAAEEVPAEDAEAIESAAEEAPAEEGAEEVPAEEAETAEAPAAEEGGNE